MGIQLKYIKLIVSIFILSGCKAQQSLLQEKKEWIWSYKSMAIYSCMCELTDNGIDVELTRHNDISFMAEPEILSPFYAKEASTYGKEYARKITPVFSDDSEFAGRKAIFTSCLSLYDNKSFNMLILKKYKEYKNPNVIKK